MQLARELEPDLAIMDVKMPKLDGIEAARKILDDRPIPIVMLTAYGQQELVSRAIEAGVFGYLVKPFRESDRAGRVRATEKGIAGVAASVEGDRRGRGRDARRAGLRNTGTFHDLVADSH